MNPVLIVFLVVCIAGVAFLVCFLTAICQDKTGALSCADDSMRPEGTGGVVKTQSFIGERRAHASRLTIRKGKWAAVIAICASGMSLRAQTTTSIEAAQATQSAQAIQSHLDKLEAEVSKLQIERGDQTCRM